MMRKKKMIARLAIGVSGLACLLTGSLQAADVCRFRGENAQGKFNETGWVLLIAAGLVVVEMR